MDSISVFFPALNEEKNIATAVEEAVSVLEKLQMDYEIIVVNDHSTDKTASVVKKMAKENSRICLVNNDGVRGYGSALKKGFSSSKKDLIFFTDADLQFDIEEISKLLKYIKNYDYVIGYRIDRKDPIHRSVNAWAYGVLVEIILGVHVRDLDCAFKLYRRSILKSISMHATGALINAEILYKLNQHKYRFKEVGVHHFPRQYGNPTGANLFVILRMFRELFKLKMDKLK